MEKDSKDQINIKVEGQNSTLTILHGKAPEHHDPRIIDIKGSMYAPIDWWENRGSLHNPAKCYVLIDVDQPSAKLVVNECDHFNATILGTTILNPEISGLGIYTGVGNGKIFNSPAELAKHLKFMKAFFADQDQYNSVIQSLEKFKVVYQSSVEKAREQNGNKSEGFAIEINPNASNLVLDFNLSIPIYVGEPKETFKVDISYDLRSNAVSLWLESVELKQLMDKVKTDAVKKILTYFVDKNIVVIQQ